MYLSPSFNNVFIFNYENMGRENNLSEIVYDFCGHFGVFLSFKSGSNIILGCIFT